VKFVGDRHLRKEDPRLLTGRGRYVADITLPGLLHAVLLRSPHAPRAASPRVDSARARAQSRRGRRGDLRRSRIRGARHADGAAARRAALGHNFAPLRGRSRPLRGEPVAAVVADSRYAAEDARDLLEVEYEPLPSAQTLAPGAPPRSTTTSPTTWPAP